MVETKITCDSNFIVGKIDSRLYGSFLEHMGRVVYTGVYEPKHTCADEDGFRLDVLETVRRMGVSCVRYPGGNFVSSYHWEDGIGPKECRPHKIDLAWKSIETNEFGTDEFMRWSRKAGVQPVFTVNLGTRGIEEAVQYLEYCNFKGGTYYSDLRRQGGIEEPYGIKMWCLGNEMDGAWQTGHKSAAEYGRLAAETGKAMKMLDPSIELIACGSSLSTMESYPAWDMEVLEQVYDVADYLALHQYYGGQERGTKYFLAQTQDMEEYIRTIRAAAQIVKAKKRSSKTIKFSVDEWGVWSRPSDTVNEELKSLMWQKAPAISEQIYTLEDALLFAGMQMVILRNADVIKIACQSLLTNVSACIMTEPEGEMWLQTIFYPFYYFANYARGTVLHTKTNGPDYSCEEFHNVPYVDSLVVRNEEDGEMAVFLVNRDEQETQQVSVEFQGYTIGEIRECVMLTAQHKKMTNQENHKAVIPRMNEQVKLEGERSVVLIPPLSFNMIRLGTE